jgi:hypothetical protein
MYIKSLQPIKVQSEGVLHIVANKSSSLTVKVFDTHGRIAKTVKAEVNQGNQDLCLNLSDLLSGTYILNAFSGDVFLRSIRFNKA